MRNTFIADLTRRAAVDDSIFLVVGDLGFSVIEAFRDRFPDRFLNVGVAEQNMTAVAAGLAREGFKVFTYSIGNFATLRCLEQIRNDVCYHELPVCVTAVGAGFMYGSLGATHHATEDIAALRALPNMRVYAPYSTVSVQAALDDVLEAPGPAYLRLGRLGEEPEHDRTVLPAPLIQHAKASCAMLTLGKIDADLIERCRSEGIDLYGICRVHPLSADVLRPMVSRYNRVIVREDHQRIGGLYGAVCEGLCEIESEGIGGVFADRAGREDDLRAHYIQTGNST